MKRIFNVGIIAILGLLLIGCGVSEEEYNKLNSNFMKLTNESISIHSENKKLKKKLDDCENGEKRIIARIDKFNQEKKYSSAIKNINLLYEKFPESNKNIKYQKLSKKLTKKIALAKRKLARKEQLAKEKTIKEKKERTKLANLQNTGMWKIKYYVDDFGEATQIGYINNSKYINGFFSNTATQDSSLNVQFLISDREDISIQLFEYGRNNPVKGYSNKEYLILIKDNEGNKLRLSGVNNSNRIKLHRKDAVKLHDSLLKGGKLKFHIIEKRTPTTEYSFTIMDAKYYNNAYRILTKPKYNFKIYNVESPIKEYY